MQPPPTMADDASHGIHQPANHQTGEDEYSPNNCILALRRACNCPLAEVPPELLVMMLATMEPQDLVNFIFAAYPILRLHNIIDPLTRAQFLHILRPSAAPNLPWPFPNEITCQMLGHFSPRELATFVFGFYVFLRVRGVTPPIDRETRLMFLLALAAEQDQQVRVPGAEPPSRLT